MLYAFRYCFLLVILIVCNSLVIAATGACDSNRYSNPKPNPKAQQWINAKIKAGEEANLESEFVEEDRVITATFIKDILTELGNQNGQRTRAVHLINAIVLGNLNLRDEKLPFTLDLRLCKFIGSVDFTNAAIGGDLEASNATFGQGVKLTDARIDGNAYFMETLFCRDALFNGTSIEKDLDLLRANFKSQADFNNLRVEGDVILTGSTFEEFTKFDGANVTRSFIATEAKFKAVTGFINLKADTILFDETKFDSELDFNGMTYRRIDAGQWPNILNVLRQSKYDAGVYTTLEENQEKNGHPDRADEVYTAQRDRELNETQNWSTKLGNLLLKVLVGYGRKPWLAFVYGLVVVFIGCFIFLDRSGMEPQKPEYESRKYNPFWYSLDLFLPFVNLQVDNIWQPKQNRVFARNYMYIHTLLGWLLIPIGLAAVTGIIKG